MPASIRFSPPRVPAHPALRWVLGRAFGPLDLELSSVEGALVWAERLGLASRITSRHEARRLADETGEPDSRGFALRRAATAAGHLRLEATATEVAGVASAMGVPLAFLKGFALGLGGWAAPGSRPAADLDVLAPGSDLTRLEAALLAAGCRAGSTPAMEHQLAPLAARAGGTVELHRCLLGVRVPGEPRSARFDSLSSAGLLSPASGFPGCFLPNRPLLLAHAAVHGLAQHGYTPEGYVALRLVADWIDLGVADSSQQEWSQVGELAGASLSAAELEGLRELVGRLSQGDLGPLDEAPSSSGAAALLHHFLAGTLDEAYASRLKLEMLAHPLSDAPRWQAFLGSLSHAFFPSAAELEIIYGTEAWPLAGHGLAARLSRRFWRPLDLVGRVILHTGRLVASRGQRGSG